MSDETRLTEKIAIAPDVRDGCDGEYGLTGWTSRGPRGTRRETIDAGTLAEVRALGEALVAFAATKPTGERKPCKGWSLDERTGEMVLGLGSSGRLLVFYTGHGWTWEHRVGSTIINCDRRYGGETFQDAEVVAEDAARALLVDGLRRLDGDAT